MTNLYIQNATLNGRTVDIRVKDGLLHEIRVHSPQVQSQADETVLDARGLTVFPPFYNTHTHSVMTLLRGYADDLPLHTWLQKHIWPAEARLTPAHVRAGMRLACLEMIKSGTVGFIDMYMHQDIAAPVVVESGMRALLGVNFFDQMPAEERAYSIEILKRHQPTAQVSWAVAAHAPYTVGAESYQELSELATNLDLKLLTHLSETQTEVNDCRKQTGLSPVAWLDSLGVLNDRLIAAHCVHVSEEDINLLAQRQVVIAHCPSSNLKLSSGIAPVAHQLKAGCQVTIATDGAASNNNLNMQEALKLATLLAKLDSAAAMPANEALRLATRSGALAMDVDGGIIEEGRAADLLLVRMDEAQTTPLHSAVSNWVYSAQASQIDTVICAGRILMQHGHVPGEEDIIAEAQDAVQTLL